MADMIFSTAFFFTTWPMPADAPGYFQNVGTTATCSAQGFFIDLGSFASCLFSVDLSMLFVLMVRYNATGSTLVRFQYWSQVIIWAMSLGFGVIYVCLGFYNPNTAYCWLGPYPYDCWWSGEECIRGGNSSWAIYINISLGFFGSLIGQIFLFGWLYRTVYEVEHQSTRQAFAVMRQESILSIDGSSSITTALPINRTRSRAVAVRGLLYIGGYLLTYILSFVEVMLQFFSVSSVDISLISGCLLATQGVWFSLIFMRQREMLTPEGRFLRNKVLHCLLPPSSNTSKDDNDDDDDGDNVNPQSSDSGRGKSSTTASNQLSYGTTGSTTSSSNRSRDGRAPRRTAFFGLDEEYDGEKVEEEVVVQEPKENVSLSDRSGGGPVLVLEDATCSSSLPQERREDEIRKDSGIQHHHHNEEKAEDLGNLELVELQQLATSRRRPSETSDTVDDHDIP